MYKWGRWWAKLRYSLFSCANGMNAQQNYTKLYNKIFMVLFFWLLEYDQKRKFYTMRCKQQYISSLPIKNTV